MVGEADIMLICMMRKNVGQRFCIMQRYLKIQHFAHLVIRALFILQLTRICIWIIFNCVGYFCPILCKLTYQDRSHIFLSVDLATFLCTWSKGHAYVSYSDHPIQILTCQLQLRNVQRPLYIYCDRVLSHYVTLWDQEPLQWRHNERHGASNHCHLNRLLNRLVRRRKISKLRVTGLCEGNPSVTGGFPLTKVQ